LPRGFVRCNKRSKLQNLDTKKRNEATSPLRKAFFKNIISVLASYSQLKGTTSKKMKTEKTTSSGHNNMMVVITLKANSSVLTLVQQVIFFYNFKFNTFQSFPKKPLAGNWNSLLKLSHT